MNPITRVQRRRTKGFKLQDQSPDGRPVLSVCRPSQWGNRHNWKKGVEVGYSEPDSKDLAKQFYFEDLIREIKHNPDLLAPLKDHHLACWCKIGEPCHADILVQLVNDKYADEPIRNN